MAARLPDTMQWLQARVPLTLLADLLDETGPDSRQIYRDEPADLDWVPRRQPAA